MELSGYLRILRLHWVTVVAITLVCLGASAAVTLAATPQYQATSQLFISADSGGTVADLNTGNTFTQQRVKSYSDIINSPRVTSRVIDVLGLNESPQALASQISADAPLNTVLINVRVTDPSPMRAARIADVVSAEFASLVDELETPAGSSTSPVKVSVVRQAQVPGAPVSPRTKVNLALGLLLGLALGVGAAVLRDTLDNTVKTPEQLESAGGLTMLGAIVNDSTTSEKPLIDPKSTFDVRAEALRTLRTNLRFVDVDHPPTTLVVTSSVAAEGKSTTSANLALALSEAGVHVILVDGDLRRPRLPEIFGVRAPLGMTDVLTGRAALDDALLDLPASPNLQLLTAGPIPPNPSELLGSQFMADLVGDLEARCELVIVDAPPALPVTDAVVLSTLASGTVLVVRYGATSTDQLNRAVQSIRAVGARVYGGVLNMVPTKGADSYYYYYGEGYLPRAAIERRPVQAAGRRIVQPPPLDEGDQDPRPASEPRAGGRPVGGDTHTVVVDTRRRRPIYRPGA